LKYHNKPCQVGAEKYRSQKERDRHQSLLLLERGGYISELRREVPFPLADAVTVQGRRRPAVRYYADFTYRNPDGFVVEDCKGMRTPVYNLKRHLMKAIHGIDILET